MGKISKPFTENIKMRANTLWRYMIKKDGYISKDEICRLLGLSNERSAREVIAALATKCPIISTSDNKGYKLAKTAEDLAEVCHCWKELDSRQAELEKRKEPLIRFYESIASGGYKGEAK